MSDFSYQLLRQDLVSKPSFFEKLFCCIYTKEQKRHNNVQNSLKKDYRRVSSVIKLLLLGSGESGKSTILKQMKIIHHKGYSNIELSEFKNIICENVFNSILSLISAMTLLNVQYEKKKNVEYGNKLKQIPSHKIILNGKSVLNEEIGNLINSLWKDSGIQEAYRQRSCYYLLDSCEYYMTNVLRIAAQSWIPSEQDVLRSRQKTVGITESNFVVDSYKFRMVDVGGQRNERRKWIHVFDCVTSVIFVTSLSEYDQVLFEDDQQNRMTESLLLFEEICNSRFFRTTPMIIFFNKSDIFDEKIQKIDLSVQFSEYTGGKDRNNAISFIRNQFSKRDKSKNREIFTNITCATSTHNIRIVFDAVKNIILKDNLEHYNLV